jgi:hypothetical protein
MDMFKESIMAQGFASTNHGTDICMRKLFTHCARSSNKGGKKDTFASLGQQGTDSSFIQVVGEIVKGWERRILENRKQLSYSFDPTKRANKLQTRLTTISSMQNSPINP